MGEIDGKKDIRDLLEIATKINDKKNPLMKKNNFFDYMMSNIDNPQFWVLVNKENGKMIACLVATEVRNQYDQYMWIDFIWGDRRYSVEGDKHVPNTAVGELYNLLLDMCRKMGYKKIRASVTRGFKFYEKFFGKKEISRMFEIEVK